MDTHSMNDGNHWIESLQMQRHPEGGWFREVYRSAENIPLDGLPDRFNGDRSFSTAIYFLLKENDFSAFHRIQQDELWHFYDGISLTIHVIDPTGKYTALKLGTDLENEQRPLAVVPAGCYFGASVDVPDSFALVGCTVAPGFDFQDFEMPRRSQLVRKFPQHQRIIEMLTRAD